MNAPDFAFKASLALKTYQKMIRELSVILRRRYMVFHDRGNLLDAFRHVLPLERTTDIGINMHVCNDALRAGNTYWC